MTYPTRPEGLGDGEWIEHLEATVEQYANEADRRLPDRKKHEVVTGPHPASIDAADLAFPKQREIQARIIGLYEMHNRTAAVGFTDHQIAARLNRPLSAIQSPRGALIKSGWLRNSGRRRSTPNGGMATIWTLSRAAVHRVALGKGLEPGGSETAPGPSPKLW